jgi:hypothetical protein
MLNDHLIRITGTRGLKRLSKKEKQDRELSWNPRFYIEKMPEYNAYKDKYLQNPASTIKTRKILVPSSKSRKIRLRSPKINMKSDSTKKLSHGKHKSMRVQIVDKAKSSIEEVYNDKKIPLEYMKIYFDSLSNLDSKLMVEALAKTLNQLYLDKNSIQYVIKAVKAREECIAQIKDMPDDQSLSKIECVEALNNLTMLSIHVVECIQNWRQDLSAHNSALLTQPFNWKGENYLILMKSDLDFLKNSPLIKKVGSEFLKGFIPAFVDKPTKTLAKRLAECEERIGKEIVTTVRETPFDIREKRKITSMEKISIATESIDKNLELDGKSTQDDFYIESCGSDVQSQVENYSKVVPDQIKACLGDPRKAYTQAITMKFPALLWVKSHNEILGLFALNIDNQKTVQTRLYISHISSKSIELLESIITIAVNYVSSNYPCDEIRVALSSPANSEGKYECDKTIKQFFDKLGFRWKRLLKEDNTHPVQLLGLGCKKLENSPNEDIFKDSIQIFYSCTGQVSKDDNLSDNFISALGVSSVLKQFPGSKSSKTLENILEKVSNTWVPPAFKVNTEKSTDIVIEDIKKLRLQIPSLQDTETTVALCSIELNWSRFLTTILDSHKYLCVYDTQISIITSGYDKVYIIPTEDQNFNVFIIPCENFTEPSFEKARQVLSQMTKVEEVINEIWVPEFNLRLENCYSANNGENKDNILCRESTNIVVKAAIHNKGNLIIEPKENSVVIRSGFLFGLMHTKVDEEFEVPYITVYVQTDDFSSSY